MNNILLIIILLMSAFFQSCSYRHVKEENAFESVVNGNSSMSKEVSYAQIENKIIGPKCLRCHSDAGGNQGSLNLETYDQVTSHLESIKQRVLVEQNMPPRAPLNLNELKYFSTWIDSENINTGNSNTKNKIAVKWPRIRDEIIQVHCIQCHSPATTDVSEDRVSTMEAGLDLTDVNVLRAKADLIFKRTVIIGDMPLNPYPKLSDTEKKLISQWMIDGMQDESEIPQPPEETSKE